ncbi:hypothetical protein BCAR13_110206 [Paraburkholderia caribensis]|nr:hypothetical protein BCAR13_110206 [Paraburkholderia caribensis]
MHPAMHPTGSGGRGRQPCGRGLWQRANLKGAAGRLKSYNLADFDRLPQCTTQGSASLTHAAASVCTVCTRQQAPPARAACLPPPFARVPGVSTVPVALNPSLRMPVEPRLHV